MIQFIATAKAVLDLLPAIIAAVTAIEQALPDGGKGEAKLELVRATLQSAYDTAEDKFGSFEALWKTVQPIVSAVVSFANAAGIFKKKA